MRTPIEKRPTGARRARVGLSHLLTMSVLVPAGTKVVQGVVLNFLSERTPLQPWQF